MYPLPVCLIAPSFFWWGLGYQHSADNYMIIDVVFLTLEGSCHSSRLGGQGSFMFAGAYLCVMNSFGFGILPCRIWGNIEEVWGSVHLGCVCCSKLSISLIFTPGLQEGLHAESLFPEPCNPQPIAPYNLKGPQGCG